MSSQRQPYRPFQRTQNALGWIITIVLSGVVLAGLCWLSLQTEDSVYYRFRLWSGYPSFPKVSTPIWLPWAVFNVTCLTVFTGRMMLKTLDKTLLFTAGSMIIYVWSSFLIYKYTGIRLGVAFPLTGMGFGLLIGSTYLAARRDQEVHLLEGHLSRLVSRDVFSEIRKRREVIGREGQHVEITSMVVDLRDFTTWAENRSPHEVNELLNRFYALVVETVFAYRGTIDKFMGDGIMVIFGAPIGDIEHRTHALSCAQTLIERQYEMPLSLGVTLHTGPAFVGFIGPADKLEYTAIGDTINLCSRLQQEAKQFNTPIIVSESVHPPEDLFEKIATLSVRGRDGEIDIYTFRTMPELTEL